MGRWWFVRAAFRDNGSSRTEEVKFDHDPTNAELVAERNRILAMLNAVHKEKMVTMRERIRQLKEFIIARSFSVPEGEDE